MLDRAGPARRELQERRSVQVAFVLLLIEAALVIAACFLGGRPGEWSLLEWLTLVGFAWLLMIPLMVLPALGGWLFGRLLESR